MDVDKEDEGGSVEKSNLALLNQRFQWILLASLVLGVVVSLIIFHFLNKHASSSPERLIF